MSSRPLCFAFCRYRPLIYFVRNRYQVSKLLEILLVREINSHLNTNKSARPAVTTNLACPGLCKSTINRSSKKLSLMERFACLIFERTTEVGAQNFVLAACAGPTSHGQLLSNGNNLELDPWIRSDMGREVQKRVFERTMKLLEMRKPGVGAAAGL